MLIRRRIVEEFTPSPRNNGHAKPTVLPKPSFKPQKWPYHHSTEDRGQNHPHQEEAHWTFSPPSQQEIDSAMITHFSVRPAASQDNQQFSDTVDKLIHSLSVQNYPQIISGNKRPSNNQQRPSYNHQRPSNHHHHHKLETTKKPSFSSYYPIGMLITL